MSVYNPQIDTATMKQYINFKPLNFKLTMIILLFLLRVLRLFYYLNAIFIFLSHFRLLLCFLCYLINVLPCVLRFYVLFFPFYKILASQNNKTMILSQRAIFAKIKTTNEFKNETYFSRMYLIPMLMVNIMFICHLLSNLNNLECIVSTYINVNYIACVSIHYRQAIIIIAKHFYIVSFLLFTWHVVIGIILFSFIFSAKVLLFTCIIIEYVIKTMLLSIINHAINSNIYKIKLNQRLLFITMNIQFIIIMDVWCYIYTTFYIKYDKFQLYFYHTLCLYSCIVKFIIIFAGIIIIIIKRDTNNNIKTQIQKIQN